MLELCLRRSWLGSSYFRYYDTELAESITLTGQISVRWVADHINNFLNKTLGTENQDFVIAMDTDSAYLNLGPLVDRFCAGKSKPEIVDYLNKVSEKIIEPEINNVLSGFCDVMSAYENCLLMGREVIADRGIWTAKKRYMLNVHDSEGVRYPKPKLKIMGIETTRSSTPSVVRDSLKEAIRIILNSDEETLIRFIDDFKKEFYAMPPEDIAFPRSVSSLLDYSNKSTIYVKATPIAVKGALLYNYYLDKYKVTNKYAKIQEGDKIKFIYLKTPNPLGGISGKDCVISFNGKLPKEFALQPYIDYEQQFIKSFIDPLTSILNVIGWSYEKKSTLEDFFT